MRPLTALFTLGLGAAFLASCEPKVPPAPAAVAAAVPDHRANPPEPLSPRAFQLPAVRKGELGNGLPVLLVENHEVPLVYVRLVINAGGWDDPADMPGLASVSMDMMNEGAGDLDAEGISAALRTLGSSLSTAAGTDGSQVAIQTLKQNLGPTLDLMASVAFEPTFPKEDWELNRKKRIQDLTAARQDPNSIASRVFDRLLYGDSYKGRLRSEAGYSAMDTSDMRKWHTRHMDPSKAMILVGGAVRMSEIVPLLEERFGGWAPPARAADVPLPTADSLPSHEASTIYLVDNPGAAQSVIRAGHFVNQWGDADHIALSLANLSIAGMFTARINMNLREDKGWTYGARGGASYSHLPGLWTVRTSVVTAQTGPSVSEILREIKQSLTVEPVTADELAASSGNQLGTFPGKFESPGYLLDETKSMWRYGLADDWITGKLDRVRAVDVAAANAAWQKWIKPDELVIVVVGDKSIIGEQLQTIGLPIVELDADAQPVGE